MSILYSLKANSLAERKTILLASILVPKRIQDVTFDSQESYLPLYFPHVLLVDLNPSHLLDAHFCHSCKDVHPRIEGFQLFLTCEFAWNY